MKYAVLKIKGHQYKVTEGQEILVDKINSKNPEAQVLLVVKDEKVSIGKPTVSGSKVSFKILKEEEKGEKIRILKYKAKSRYTRRMGFRPIFTRLLVEKIS